MSIDRLQIKKLAEEERFREEFIEKVVRLVQILNGFQDVGLFSDCLVLGGGTAINLFVFNKPRLSVDIDLNYIGSLDREEMLKDRSVIENTIRRFGEREGYSLKYQPKGYAGGKSLFTYTSSSGSQSRLAVDISFTARLPLYPIDRSSSNSIGQFQALDIPTLNVNELAAGKVAALFARCRSRDVFDTHSLLSSDVLDLELFRIAFLVYGATSRKDWRTIKLEDVEFKHNEFHGSLLPMLPNLAHKGSEVINEWGQSMVVECREMLAPLLRYTIEEQEFLDQVLDDGVIHGNLLTDDIELQNRIDQQPHLLWKTQNVRKHKGIRR